MSSRRARSTTPLSHAPPSTATKKNTGIVQGKATVQEVDQRAAGAATLTIAFPPGALAAVTIGASVAINGTCLTVRGGVWVGSGRGVRTDSLSRRLTTPLLHHTHQQVVTADGDVATFDVVDETLRVTNLGGLTAGRVVNFER